MFEVIPAIDLKDGRCVRLVQGDFQRQTVFGDDPAGVAVGWESAGAERIHVVDLDGARGGKPVQLDAIKAIASAVRIAVQLGGGLRRLEDIDAVFDAGVDRVVLGTAAIEDPGFLATALEQHGERIAVGIDAREGRVAVRAWQAVADADAYSFAAQLASDGVRTMIYTDIGKDGTLEGPNLAAVQRMITTVPSVHIIASGGVRSVDDLFALRDVGARGVIVGRALYTGDVDLSAAISAMSAQR